MDRQDTGITKVIKHFNAVPRLSRQEERTLFRQWELSGRKDADVANKICNANMRYIIYMLNHLGNKHLNVSEGISIGYLTLRQCLEKFDLSFNTRFITFAKSAVKHEVQKYIIKNASIAHVPRRVQQLAIRVHKYIKEVYLLRGEEPRREELRKHFKLSNRDLVNCATVIYHTAKMNVENIKNPEASAEEKYFTKETVNLILSVLDQKHKQVFELRFGKQEFSVREISDKIGMSKSWVSLALKKIRKLATSPNLREMADKMNAETYNRGVYH